MLRRSILVGALFVGLAIGTAKAAPLRADGDCVTDGCCDATSDCGSPLSNRCCSPSGGEAACSHQCADYCHYGQTGCPS